MSKNIDTLRLNKKVVIEIEIKILTGLHIGGTNSDMNIGGIDNSIIRHPVTRLPYIPGSSLKGKMRSLIELSNGTLGRGMSRDIQTGPTQDASTLSAQLFGYTQHREYDNAGKPINDLDKYKHKTQQPSRLIVRDMFLSDTVDQERDLVEIKTETVIDRITSAAMPRQMERIAAGTSFTGSMVLNIFEEEVDQENVLLDTVFQALRLVQDDYLGGAGSRGSGHVKFAITNIEERTTAFYQGNDNAEKIDLTNFGNRLNGLIPPSL